METTNKGEITIPDIVEDIIRKSAAMLQKTQTMEEYFRFAPVVTDMCCQYIRNTY